MNKSVSIITDLDGSKIALINDIRFKSRKGIDWNEVEQYLKEYIGEYFEISETSEKIYIGSDFPDEFSHSNDTKKILDQIKRLNNERIYKNKTLVVEIQNKET